MNTNPNAKTILCYGDCNVYGYIPITEKRYPANIRWPGVLQNILGNNFYIIEEGLTRRNTSFNDPKYIGMDGFHYLVPCILSHNPLNWVILWLSTRNHYDKFLINVDKTANS